MAESPGETEEVLRAMAQWSGVGGGAGTHGRELVGLIWVRKGPGAEGEWKGHLQSRWEKNG